MIACPKCGSETSVRDTRTTGTGVRRRRACLGVGCDGRVTTYEMPVGDGRRIGALGFIRLDEVERIRCALDSVAPLNDHD